MAIHPEVERMLAEPGGGIRTLETHAFFAVSPPSPSAPPVRRDSVSPIRSPCACRESGLSEAMNEGVQ